MCVEVVLNKWGNINTTAFKDCLKLFHIFKVIFKHHFLQCF